MSITRKGIERVDFSALDDHWCFAESDQIGLTTSLKYVFDLYDANSNHIFRAKVYPHPTNGKGYFNYSRMIESLFDYQWFANNFINYIGPTEQHIIVKSLGSGFGDLCYNYTIQFGEEYGGTIYPNQQSVSGRLFCHNIKWKYERQTYDDYLYRSELMYGTQTIGNYGPAWITSRGMKTGRQCKTKDHLLIGMYVGNDPFSPQITFESYIGNTLHDFYIFYPDASYTWGPNNQSLYSWTPYHQIDVGTAYVENILDLTGCDYYRCQIKNSIGESYWFYVYLDCCELSSNEVYSSNMLHDLIFLNRFGVYDSVRFDGATKESFEIQKRYITKSDYQMVPNETWASPFPSYIQGPTNNSDPEYIPSPLVNTFVESKINVSQNIGRSLRLLKQNMTERDYQWLSELIESPQVYLRLQAELFQNGVNTNNYSLYPVAIKNTNYDLYQPTNGGLNNLEVMVEITNKRNGFVR